MLLDITYAHPNVFISNSACEKMQCNSIPPRRKLSDLDSGRAIGWLQEGVAVRQVAQRLGMSHSVIRLRQRFPNTGGVQEQQRSGRPRITTPREDRYIERQALQERTTTANNIRRRLRDATSTVVSDQTIRNRLHTANLRVRPPAIRPRLTDAHTAARPEWCTQHVRWTHEQWAQVLFTDESRFCLDPTDRRNRVWRRHGERFADEAVLERNRYGGGIRHDLGWHKHTPQNGSLQRGWELEWCPLPSRDFATPGASCPSPAWTSCSLSRRQCPGPSLPSSQHVCPSCWYQQNAVARKQPGPQPHRTPLG